MFRRGVKSGHGPLFQRPAMADQPALHTLAGVDGMLIGEPGLNFGALDALI